MFQKIKEYISLLKNTYHSYRTDRLFKKAVRKTATHPDCSFLSWPVEKQSALLDNLKMLSVFYLMTGVTAGDTRTDFEKMPESVRQKGLSLLSSDLQKKLLMMRADDQNRYSFYNFFSAPAAFQNTFLFGLCSSEERLSLLKNADGQDGCSGGVCSKESDLGGFKHSVFAIAVPNGYIVGRTNGISLARMEP